MIRRLGSIYLVIQSTIAAAWWIALLIRPEWRAAFLPQSYPDSAMLAFIVPDCLIFICSGYIGAAAISKRSKTDTRWLALHVGAASYAALYTFTIYAQTGEAWISSALMVLPLVVPAALLWFLWNDEPA